MGKVSHIGNGYLNWVTLYKLGHVIQIRKGITNWVRYYKIGARFNNYSTIFRIAIWGIIVELATFVIWIFVFICNIGIRNDFCGYNLVKNICFSKCAKISWGKIVELTSFVILMFMFICNIGIRNDFII